MKLRNILAAIALILAMVLSLALIGCNGADQPETTTTASQGNENTPSETTTANQGGEENPDNTTAGDTEPEETTTEVTVTGLQGSTDDEDTPFGDIVVAD